MKSSLFTTILSFFTMTYMVLIVGSSGLRGLQGVSVDNSGGVPSVKITGLATLLQIINSASEFSNATFDVITLDSFSQSVTDQGVEYEGLVTLANDQGVNVTGLINGTWDPEDKKLLFSVSKYVEPEGNNGTNNTNSTNSTNPIPSVPAGYTYISPEDLANNARAQGALAFGVTALIQTGISQYKIPAASPDYNVTNLSLAAYRNTSIGNLFIFNVNTVNALNYKVDTNITVRYRTATQAYDLAGYSFHSYGYPASAIVIPPPTNTSNNTGNTTAPGNSTVVIPDNTTIIVDNSTGTDNTTIIVNNPNDNSTTPVDNSTTVIIPPINETIPTNTTTNTATPSNTTNTTNTTTPANNTTPQVTADGYSILSADQLANDSIAQAALAYGANALIQKGISQNKIPAANPNYTISNIYFAGSKKQVIGTSYKFAVNMTNVDYVKVDANVTVFYRYSTKAYSLNGYWFRSYNYSSTALTQNPNVTIPIVNTTSVTSNTTDVTANNTVLDNSGSR